MNEFLTSSLFFGIALSLICYQLGLFINRKWHTPFGNPLLIAILLTIASLVVLKIDYPTYYASAHYLSYLLTPATVALAVGLYEQIHILKENWLALLGGILAGVLSGLTCIWLMCLLLGFDHGMYVTLLPKSVTTAIGIGLSEEVGGYPAITVAAIVLTGNLGNIFAEVLCKVLRIRNPIAQGIAIGSAAHAIGTARANTMGEVQGAMSSLALVLTGLMTVVAMSFYAPLL